MAGFTFRVVDAADPAGTALVPDFVTDGKGHALSEALPVGRALRLLEVSGPPGPQLMHIQDEIQTALKLGTRHVVVHGIDLSSGLPDDTVATLGSLPNELTLPVACGELIQQ